MKPATGGRLHTSRYLPELDGLRALSVLAVVAFHLKYFGVRDTRAPESAGDHVAAFVLWVWHSGWVGVDAFFMLSGFLITLVILRTRQQEGAVRAFIGRRLLRIVPAYVLLLVLAELLWYFGIARQRLWNEQNVPDLGRIWLWTYTSNFAIAFEGWTPFNSLPRFMCHTWSLALEEQFYLLWPFAAFLLPRRHLWKCAVVAIVFAVVFRYAWLELANIRTPDGADITWVAPYTLLPARLDTLMLGALLAILGLNGGLERLRPYAWAGLGLALAGMAYALNEAPSGAYGLRDRPVILVGYFSNAIFFSSLMVVIVTYPGSLVGRVLRSSLLVMIGRVSYGIYLFHFIVVFLLVEVGLSGREISAMVGSRLAALAILFVLAAGISTLVALASWHLVEKRVLRYKDRWWPTPGGHAPSGLPRAKTTDAEPRS